MDNEHINLLNEPKNGDREKKLRFLKQNKRKIATEKEKKERHCMFFLFTNCAYIYKNLSNRNIPGPKENTKP